MNNARLYFVLAALGASVGIGNIWLYPNLSFRLTGLFFIPYLFALFLLGVPLLMLEFSIGQHFNRNIVDLFASIRKEFSSIGWLMLFNAMIVMSFYAVVLAWHLIYFFASFGLQWKNDAKLYFFSNILNSAEFHGFTTLSLAVFIALIVAWLIIFLYIRKGFESLKKYFLITMPVLIGLMLFFLLYSLKLQHALSGIHSFLNPKFGSLFDLDVWINSFSLAVLSLGLSFGIMHAVARKSGKGFILETSSVVVVFELLFSIAIGLIVFGVLGFLSFKNGIDVNGLAAADYSSGFTVLAQALPFFHRPVLISFLFFLFLSLFFLLGASALAYSITHVLVHKFRTKHFNAAVVVCGFGFLLGLLFVIRPGFYIMELTSHFIYYNILIALLLELLAVFWFFDSEKIVGYINQVSTLKIGKVWKITAKYIVPLILLALLFFRVKTDISGYKDYPMVYLIIFGIGVVVIPIILSLMMPQRIFDRR